MIFEEWFENLPEDQWHVANAEICEKAWNACAEQYKQDAMRYRALRRACYNVRSLKALRLNGLLDRGAMMEKIILHYAISFESHGETRIRSLCNRARADVIKIDTIERGQNVTHDPKQVTCSFCKRILPIRLEKERLAATPNAIITGRGDASVNLTKD